MTRSGIAKRLARAVGVAAKTTPGLRKRRVSPHTFRHTTAMHLLQAGNDITVIALWLGHASPATTHEYVEADLKMKREALSKLQAPATLGTRSSPPMPSFASWMRCDYADHSTHSAQRPRPALAPGPHNRKNWLFAGSDNGSRTAAVLFSLIATCQRHDVEPFAYLRDVLPPIAAHTHHRLAELLPDRWQPQA